MTIENRREREKEEMKQMILSAAGDIVAAEGFEKLSIRKIAARIEYSPAIIYHYFSDKDEITNALMQSGYRKIVSAILSANIEEEDPESRFIEMMKNYIYTALSMSDEFMAAHLNQSPQALKHTSSLFRGASKEKAALIPLYKSIKEMNAEREPSHEEIEMTAQLIAVSSFGVIVKLIMEKDISEEQRSRLIEYYSTKVAPRMAKIGEGC